MHGNLDENKISWVAWKKVISPIHHGELGIGSHKSSNEAMVSKWWWGFRTTGNTLWCNIIQSIHDLSGGLDDATSLRSKRGPWYHIAKLKDDLISLLYGAK
ncbi:RNA-directed DNA polymerase, eukaryota, Reverse transcriptase zinc-binding domain protein [Artemisia annua]|uniref:RNA-directed DNA polymerase, eukaryota, Reverse transcriptase zinc-binding domain protein n=1 Tax=Artemisia annua TaxID=35608 RepID=A0A2U1P0I6_ARTAN|nr:RNA-directed DNA polymerase, eukaryota, Reverse transcriptase zinc-binding domain protein [Artemisia annua]